MRAEDALALLIPPHQTQGLATGGSDRGHDRRNRLVRATAPPAGSLEFAVPDAEVHADPLQFRRCLAIIQPPSLS